MSSSQSAVTLLWLFLTIVLVSCEDSRVASEGPAEIRASTLEVAKDPALSTSVQSSTNGTTIEELINEDIGESGTLSVADPLEKVNRLTHGFNDKAYSYVVKPVSKAYGKAMPDPFEEGLSNAFSNLRYPKRLASNLLQGRFKGAAKETGKFFLNSTAGVAGIMKPSERHLVLQNSPEDLGQALGSWNLGHGPYLVLPLLGPSTLRDTVGMVGDGFLDPISYIGPVPYRLGARGLEVTNDSPRMIADYDALKQGSIDPYTSLRDAYVQAREKLLLE